MVKKKESVKKESISKKKLKDNKRGLDKKKGVDKKGGGKVPLTWIFLTIIIAIVLSLAVSYMVVSLSQGNNDYSLDSGKIVVQVIPDSSQGKIVVEVVDESSEKEVSE